MTSGMTLSSKSLIMKPQRPPSTHFLTPLPDTLLLKLSIQNIQGILLRVKTIIHDIKDDPNLYDSDQEPSMSHLKPPFLTHFH